MSARPFSYIQRLRQRSPQSFYLAPFFLRRAHKLPSMLHRCTPSDASCVPCSCSSSIRLSHTHNPTLTAADSTSNIETTSASAGEKSAVPPTPVRDRFLCPECNKRFLCAANLLQHRTARHGLHVVTPQATARAALTATNAALQRELAELRARVKQLKEEIAYPTASFNSYNSSSNNKNSSTDGDKSGAGSGIKVIPDAAGAGMAKRYPSAVPTGQLMEVDADLEAEWKRSGVTLGTGISFLNCVGTVLGPVRIGRLNGAAAAVATEAAPRVLQFTLEAHGYRERRPGQLKMYRTQILVRYIPSQPYHERDVSKRKAEVTDGLFSVCEGDVVRVEGHYGLHNSYDMVSKLPVENVVVEANYVGLLRAAGTKEADVTSVPTVIANDEKKSAVTPPLLHSDEGNANETRAPASPPASSAAAHASPPTPLTSSFPSATKKSESVKQQLAFSNTRRTKVSSAGHRRKFAKKRRGKKH